MFFFRKDDYFLYFAIIGDDEKICRYENFANNRCNKRSNFSSVALGGYKMVGFVWMPANVLMDKNNQLGRSDLIDLIYHHHELKEKQGLAMEFEEWLSLLPLESGMMNRPYVGLPAVLRSYEGEWFFAQVVGTKLKLLELSESCFIKNGVITTLAEAESKQLQAKEDQLTKELEYIRNEQARRKLIRYELIEQLKKSQVLNFVK
jgi:hypothetical protein